MTDEQSQGNEADHTGIVSDDRVVVLTQNGMATAEVGAGGTAPSEDRREPTNPADLVEEPAKVMRIGAMIKQLLEEVRNSPLDEAGRTRLADIHERSIKELKDGLAPELVDELDRIALPFSDESPSDAELRIAQAQLVGWLEGLFHGIQTALVAQQMAAQAQLQQMRALPPGHTPAPGGGMPGTGHGHGAAPGSGPAPSGRPGGRGEQEGTGQYL